MRNRFAKIMVSLFFGGIGFLGTKAYAMCPICTLAVGGALVLLERYGVDNTISGIWFGGLAVSMSFWTINWLQKKNWNSLFTSILIFIFYYASMIIPLYLKKMIGLPTKQLWGIDKVILGMMVGSIFFYLSHLLYLFLKKHNNNKAYFPFQRVAMPILALSLLSAVFYFVTKG